MTAIRIQPLSQKQPGTRTQVPLRGETAKGEDPRAFESATATDEDPSTSELQTAKDEDLRTSESATATDEDPSTSELQTAKDEDLRASE